MNSFNLDDLPTSEYEQPKPRPARPKNRVFRVLCGFHVSVEGHHVQEALKAFLARPEPLPPDPPYAHSASRPLTVRLDPAQVEKARKLAGESNRARLLRRLVWWKFFRAVWNRPTAPVAKPQPVASVAPVTPRPVAPVLPKPPSAGRRELLHSEFRDWTDRHCGQRVEPQSNARYFLRADGAVEERAMADGKLLRLWEKLF